MFVVRNYSNVQLKQRNKVVAIIVVLNRLIGTYKEIGYS